MSASATPEGSGRSPDPRSTYWRPGTGRDGLGGRTGSGDPVLGGKGAASLLATRRWRATAPKLATRLRRGTVPGMATRYGANGGSPSKIRSPTDCAVQRGRFSARPGAVTRSASGTNGVAVIESNERDEGGENGEQCLHRDR